MITSLPRTISLDQEITRHRLEDKKAGSEPRH